LRDNQWERLREFVPDDREGNRNLHSDERLRLHALRGWRDLPEKFGSHGLRQTRQHHAMDQMINSSPT